MFRKRKEYDIVFSIGEACSCSSSLRASDLQEASYPLDWVFGEDFIGRCKILASEFRDYINKEDLEYTYSERSIKCKAYHNKLNDLTFNHDFLENVPFDEMYDKVFEKYQRRINRVLDKIKNSKKILIVYIETPVLNHEIISDEDIIRGVDIVLNKFKKEDNTIDFLYMQNTKGEYKEKLIKENILKIECDYKDHNSDIDFVVDFKVLKKVLKNLYKLKVPRFYYFNKKIKKFLVNFVPKKALRHKLRVKYHLR